MHLRLMFPLLLCLLWAACQSEPALSPRRQSFGPPNSLPGMSPANVTGSQGAQGFNASTPSFHPTPTGSFKGY